MRYAPVTGARSGEPPYYCVIPNMAEADSVVSEECIEELLEFFTKGSYKAKSIDRRYEIIHKMCLHLVARDYEVEVIDNKSGQLCGHYPSELLVIEGHRMSSSHPTGLRVNNAVQLRELIAAARFARCRSRFVMPVILFEDKNICRSATLSTMAELYGRSGMDWIFTGGEFSGGGGRGNSDSVPAQATPPSTPTAGEESELMTRVRGQDVQLLKAVGVRLICDLMVEKKKSKYGLSVASSEKVDKWARYCDFWIASMPYPGCEFFREYKDNSFNPEGLQFDWSQSMIDADLLIPYPLQQLTQVQFKAYQDWDLVCITQSYLKLFLRYIQHYDGSLLIHCISGWDRTPLFISLLRLSLWADHRAHESLSPKEILYFTLAYDWFTFGHPFKERHEKGEEIMFFCFDFLKYMTSEDFSVNSTHRSRHNISQQRGNSATSSANRSASPTHCNSSHQPPTPATTADYSDSLQLGESWVKEEVSPMACSSSGRVLSERNSDGYSHPSVPERPTSSYSPPTNHSPPHPHQYPHHHHPPPHPPPPSARAEKLLAVRTLFQKMYRTVVPEVQPQAGAMAFATGLLSRLTASFAGGVSSTEV